MLKIVNCETADISHRNKALSGCLDILKGFLTGITSIPLNLNSDLCVMGAMFIEEFSVLETPPYIQATPSIHTHTHAYTPSHSTLTKNRHTRKHSIDENSTMSKSRSNSNSSDAKHDNKGKDVQKNMQVNKMKNMKVESNELSASKEKEIDEDKNKYVNIQGNEIEEEEGDENNTDSRNDSIFIEEDRSIYHDDNDNDNDNEEDDNFAIHDWLHYCDQSGIDLSLAHAQTVYLSSLNEQSNNSNINNSSSNSNSSNSKAGEGVRSRTGSVRSSTTPTHDREREKGRDRGRDRDSIDDKIAQTRARSHLLLALPSIVSIICLNIPHTSHTSTHKSSNDSAGTNTGVNPSSTSNSSQENRETEENEGLKQLREAACRAVSRVDMTALVESYNGLEERAKTLKAENTLLQVEVNNLNANANAANLPF